MYRSHTIIITTQHNASYVEKASRLLVLVPVFLLIIVQTYQTMIIVSPGENPQTAHLRGYNHAPCVVILARGKHPPTKPRTLRCWSEPRTLTATQRGGDRASGASQIACLGSGKPPTRRNSLPCSPLLTVLPSPT